jgi:radical SAM protein with 4Fe4S-binding SPASM domain
MTSTEHADVLSSPLQAAWIITSRCNIECDYCLENARTPGAPDETDEVRDLIAQELAANRVLQVLISGGEPLLVEKLPEYVNTLASAGVAVRVTSNGTLLTDDHARALVDAGVRVVEISMHPVAGTRPLEAVRELAAAGARVVGRVVITGTNATDAAAIASPLFDAGVERVVFQEVVPLGRALNGSTGFPALQALHSLQEAVACLEQEHGAGSARLLSISIQEEKAGGPVECSIDMAVRKSCEIRPGGNVQPCSPAVALGIDNMISEKGLAQCWRDLPGLFGRHGMGEPVGPCAECRKAPRCSGGCRALFKTADADPDILCRFREVAL